MSLTVNPRAHALLQAALAPGESLRWADRPRAWAYIAPPRWALGLGLLWGAFDSFYMAGAFGLGLQQGLLENALLRLLALQALPMALLLGWPLLRWLAWRNRAYGLSARGPLLSRGWMARRTARTPWDQVESVDLRVSGGAFGAGDVTLHLAAPAKPLRFHGVDDAFHVSTLARQLSLGADLEEGKTPA